MKPTFNVINKTALLLILSLFAFTLTGCEAAVAFGLGLGVVGIILGIILFIMVIWAIVDIVQKPYDLSKKLLWILIIFLIPYIGAILYFILERNSGAKSRV